MILVAYSIIIFKMTKIQPHFDRAEILSFEIKIVGEDNISGTGSGSSLFEYLNISEIGHNGH